MILVFGDIETTGFSKTYDDILEAGFIRTDENLNIIPNSSLNLYFYKPKFKIENPRAQAVHHLTRDFLRDYENDFNVNIAKMYSCCHNCVFVGKNNLSFDTEFILNFVNRNIMDKMLYMNINLQIDIQDLMAEPFQKWYREKTGAKTSRVGKLEEYPAVCNFRLEDLKREFYELFLDRHPEIEARGAEHCALYDAFVTYKVAKWLFERGILKI